MSAAFVPLAGRQQTVTTSRVAAAARMGVRRVEHQVPELCGGWRVKVGMLARRLGIAVTVREDLGVAARWRREALSSGDPMQPLWRDNSHVADVIDIRPGLGESVRRFALAHEIGHVVLYREFARWAARLSPYEHEVFANAFAVELLIPRTAREEVAERFRAATEPVELLRLSGTLGLSPRTLLRFAARHGWMHDLDVAWLDIRCLPNRFTGQDRRMRVYDTVLDRERWFIPSNRTVAGAFGSDEWLHGMTRRTRHAELELEISKLSAPPGPRYVRECAPVSVAALRLRKGAEAGRGMEIIARVSLSARS